MTAVTNKIEQALSVLTRPFLDQNTEHIYFARSDDGCRYYVGAVPAMNDQMTGRPPHRQVRVRASDLSCENAYSDICRSLERQSGETFADVALPTDTWIAVILHTTGQLAVASVRSGSLIRKIRYRWKEKDASVVPPDNWWETVIGECRFQDTNKPTMLDMFRSARRKR